jgi:uncharacterized membrane protein
MTTFFIAMSTWLHTLATIVMIGYFVFISLIFLPVLEKHLQGEALKGLLEQVSGRLRPYFGLSLLLFIVTGTYLMLSNEQYQGLGHFFSNPWSGLMVIKHFIVLIFLVLAVVSERAYLKRAGEARPEALKSFRRALNINMLLGMLILLLTSIAQAV